MKKIMIVIPILIICVGVYIAIPRNYKNDSEFGKIYAIYNVSGDSITVEKEWKDSKPTEYKALWEKTVRILPKNYDQLIKKYVVFSDGREGINASTVTKSDDNSEYEFYLDFADAYDSDGNFESIRFALNVVHEYGHAVAQNNTQIDVNREDLGTFILPDGRLEESSYLYAFYKSYWVAQYDDALARRGIEDPQDNRDAQLKFFNENQDEFITDYATVTINEDFAESFAYFVLSSEIPDEKLVKYDKLRFFYQYDEMVQMREEMRRNIDEYIKK